MGNGADRRRLYSVPKGAYVIQERLSSCRPLRSRRSPLPKGMAIFCC